MTFERQTRCIDCNAEGRKTPRAALKPGPRCDEHWRAKKKQRSIAVHANRIEAFFEITGDQYWMLYDAQQGKCLMCRRATGQRKRLAVDHDHGCDGGHDPKMGCARCIRALLCGPCNELIGRYDVAALIRAILVLIDKPAQRILKGDKDYDIEQRSAEILLRIGAGSRSEPEDGRSDVRNSDERNSRSRTETRGVRGAQPRNRARRG